MSIGLGLLVFFVSLIALVAELVLYFILGMGAAFSAHSASTVGSLAFFFVGLMIFTGAMGILYPICAVIATVAKNKKLGGTIFVILIALIMVGYLASALTFGGRARHTAPVIKSVVKGPTQEISPEVPKTAVAASKTDPEAEYIRQGLELKNVKIGEGYGKFDMPGYSKPKKGIYGTIKNIGDKSIGSMQITVYFLDTNTKRVGEKNITILSTASIYDKDSPLKPNYTKDFGYIIENDAPSDWAGKVEVEISKIRFEAEGQ